MPSSTSSASTTVASVSAASSGSTSSTGTMPTANTPVSTPAPVAAPASVAAASQAVAPSSPSLQSLAASVLTGLFGGFDPTQPGAPAAPLTPNPLSDALLAAYRQTQTGSAIPATAASTTSRVAAPTATTDLTVANTIPVDPYQIALSPDGKTLYGTSAPYAVNSSGQPQGFIEVVDTSTNTQVGAPIPVGQVANGVAVNPVTNRVYVTALNPFTVNVNGQHLTGATDSLVVIDPTTSKVIDTIPLTSLTGTRLTETTPSSAQNVAVSPDGSRVYVADTTYTVDLANPFNHTFQPSVYVFDTTTNTQVGAPIPIGPSTNPPSSTPSASQILVSPSGDRLYVTTVSRSDINNQLAATQTIYTVNPSTGATVGTPIVLDNGLAGSGAGMALSPNGKKLYVETVPASALTTSPTTPPTQPQSATVLTYDTATGQQIGTPITITGFGPMTVSPDGKTLYVADVSDSRTGQSATFQPVPSVPSQTVYLGSVTGYDSNAGAVVSNPVTVGVMPTSLAVNSAGTKLYVANSDNTISVINITPATTSTGNPLELVSSLVIGLSSFVQAATTDFGVFLGSVVTAANRFVQTANTSVVNTVVPQVTTQVTTQVNSDVHAVADGISSFATQVENFFGSLLPHGSPGGSSSSSGGSSGGSGSGSHPGDVLGKALENGVSVLSGVVDDLIKTTGQDYAAAFNVSPQVGELLKRAVPLVTGVIDLVQGGFDLRSGHQITGPLKIASGLLSSAAGIAFFLPFVPGAEVVAAATKAASLGIDTLVLVLNAVDPRL
ncbi:hypothetical protein Mycsm_06815 (plasmid) [Mycobacterium sp. JS623]|nr:hypothetical protein Mycsm_06815 [Mycobacterium sp. JS623]